MVAVPQPTTVRHYDRVARQRRKRAFFKGLETAVLVITAVVIVFPILWMVVTAFKPAEAVYHYSLLFTPTFDNFREVFSERWHIGDRLLNSCVIAIGTTVIAVPMATAASYAFSRLRFPMKRTLFMWMLLTQFIPAVVVVLPFYVMFRRLGMLDTYPALIIVDLAIVLPYAVWTIKGFIDSVPVETEEAALVDGASRSRVIWDIVVPMARPGIITASIFCFILSWNEFLFGFILSRQRVVPLSVGILSFTLERGTVWEYVAATGILITIPMFFLTLVIQRYFTKGMNVGAVR